MGSSCTTGSRPSASLTGPVSHASSPLRAETTSRDGRVTGGTGTPTSPAFRRCTAGSGNDETPNALPGVSDVTCWPRLGAGRLSPVTLPSQVSAWICAGQRLEHAGQQAGAEQPGAEARREAGERGGGERRELGHMDGHAVGVQQHAGHLEPLQALGREPVGHDGDHRPAGLDARAQRLHEHAGLLGAGRLGDGVYASLRADDTLRLQAEGDDHRGAPRGLPVRTGSWRMGFPSGGHRGTIEGKQRRQRGAGPGRADTT